MPANNIHTIDNSGGPQGWYESLPIITRYWFGAALLTTCLGNFGFLSPMALIYNWESILNRFEIWRFITPFLYVGWFGPDMETLFTLYNLVVFSQRHELSPCNTGAGGNTADYAFALMFGMASIIITLPLMNMIMPPGVIFARSLVFFVLYSWSKRFPTAPVSLWFFQLKAIQLPFACVLFNIAVGKGFADMVHGIVIGHVYYFLVDVAPIVYGKDYLHTPQYFIDLFGGRQPVVTQGYLMHSPAGRSPVKEKSGKPTHNWGGGQVLGSR